MKQGEVPVGETVSHLLPGAGDADAAVQHGAAQGRRDELLPSGWQTKQADNDSDLLRGSIYRSGNHIFLPLNAPKFTLLTCSCWLHFCHFCIYLTLLISLPPNLSSSTFYFDIFLPFQPPPHDTDRYPPRRERYFPIYTPLDFYKSSQNLSTTFYETSTLIKTGHDTGNI
jgi:hypothetical protein